MTRLTTPLRFERHFVEKVWGGRSLERNPGIALPADVPVGETWEVVDREHENSVVVEGPFAGRTLADLVEGCGADLLGSIEPTAAGRFPLLVKYIDASDDLSVQVHPDDTSAERIGGGAQGKTEAWYILDAAEGAAVYAGLQPGVTAEQFAAAADGPGVVDMLVRWEVQKGDCILVTGGTVHAIGAGVTLAEVQQNSDTTYRIWDWGRMGLDGKPRETHVAMALECVAFDRTARPPVRVIDGDGDGAACAALTRSAYFGMNRVRVSTSETLSANDQFQIYCVVQGTGRLIVEGTGGSSSLGRGDTWLVPAAAGDHSVVSDGDGKDLVLLQLCARP